LTLLRNLRTCAHAARGFPFQPGRGILYDRPAGESGDREGSMRHAAHTVRRAGAWDRAADAVTLDHEGRFLRRRLLTTDGGAALQVDLAETVSLADGDAFETADGRFIAVRAAAEPLAEVTAGRAELARLAWHIGNRHAPAEIGPERILIRRDHVIEAMLERLGATVRHVEAPFQPEGGAYGHGRTHGHHHGGAGDAPDGHP
jgi:urease accessory protein